MRHLLAVSLAAAALVAAAAQSASAAPYHPCAPTSHAYPLYAKNTSCGKAQSVARSYGTRYLSKRVQGFWCRVTGLDSSDNPVVLCSSGARRVRWHAY
jgi:hypothetical protein